MINCKIEQSSLETGIACGRKEFRCLILAGNLLDDTERTEPRL